MLSERQEQQDFQDRMIAAVSATVDSKIESKVNGKILKLSGDFNEYVKKDIEWKAIDEAWKENANPAINAMTAALGFGKTTMWILGILGLFATILGTVIAAAPWIVPHDFHI